MWRVICFAWLLAVAIATPCSAQFQLLDAGQLERLRAGLPRLESTEWDATLRSPFTLWYTDAELPRAYQHAGGFHSPSYNISGDPTDQHLRHGEGGNANVQFPWKTAGGGDRAVGLATIKAIYLPERPGGGRWPVVVSRGQLEGHPGDGPEDALRWIYPAGAVFFEVLTLDVNGRRRVFEVRARLRELDAWGVEVFRPFPSCEDLAATLEQLDAERYASQVVALRRPEALQVVDVTDRANRTRPAFVGSAGVAWLPTLDSATVDKLLDRPFKVATGAKWKTGTNGATCYAPTTATPGQLVPAGYMGSLVGTDSDSCAKCHDSPAKHARHFDRHRGWYGHVRGDDGIFSFHPVAPNSVSYNGGTFPPALRREFVAAGVVAWYSPAAHPPAVYRRRVER